MKRVVPILVGCLLGMPHLDGEEAARKLGTLDGAELTSHSKGEAGNEILSKILDRAATDKKFAATEEELQKFADHSLVVEQKNKRDLFAQKSELEKSLLDASSEEEKSRVRAALKTVNELISSAVTDNERTSEEKADNLKVLRELGHVVIRQWKFKKEIYQRYGGEVVFQQAGSEPIGAYKALVGELHRKKELILTQDGQRELDKSLAKPGTTIEPPTEAAKAILTAPWDD